MIYDSAHADLDAFVPFQVVIDPQLFIIDGIRVLLVHQQPRTGVHVVNICVLPISLFDFVFHLLSHLDELLETSFLGALTPLDLFLADEGRRLEGNDERGWGPGREEGGQGGFLREKGGDLVQRVL